MKKNIFTLITALLLTLISANSQMMLKSVPEKGFSGIQILIMEDGTGYFSRDLIDIRWDEDVSILNNVIQKNSDLISLKIPDNATIGFHTIKVIMDDNVEGILPFKVEKKPETGNDQINGYDPDPNTQKGKPIWAGKNPKGIKRGQTVYNPSGGYRNNSIPCNQLHKIDGYFTDSLAGGNLEWSNIIPLQGAFANLYLDYCDKDGIMYLLNDWKLGTGTYDTTTCYNLFEFTTGNGSEKWWVKVWNSVSKGIEVYRNGINVSEDTNYVVGGRYGYGESLLEDSLHTMWEFGLRTQGGIFVMWLYADEVGSRKIGGTDVKVICDDDGYGLVQAPRMVTGNFGNGTKTYLDDRYIPIQGVAGLVTEPGMFSGTLWNDSASVRKSGEDTFVNSCSGNHIIDGLFSLDEWDNSQPAQGTYSNLYADYCDSVLYILNDWILGTEEPDEKNCYNLFELYTGDASEHWGIYVYHDTAKGIRVFRNGEEVSNDSNIVLGGRFNFDKSPNLDTAHTIYEFGIKVKSGNWHLFLCDPGPASFCDDDPRPAPREITPGTGIRMKGQGNPGDHTGIIPIEGTKKINLVVGTSEDTQNWYCKKFEATVKFNPEFIKSINFNLPSSNVIADDLTLEIDSTVPGLMKITGRSNTNFRGSGDLFEIEAYVSSNGSGSQSDLKIDVLLANRTTFMRKFKIPKLVFDLVSGVDELQNNLNLSSINLYPNPNVKGGSSLLEFNLNQPDDVSIEMFDIIGNKYIIKSQRRYTSGLHRLNITVDNLTSGIYFLRLHGKNQSRIIKFEIIK
jgi:hypothetical protein